MEDLAGQLQLIYCGTMAIEFMHINVSFRPATYLGVFFLALLNLGIDVL